MFARFARDEEQRHQCGVGHRFVEIPDDLRQRGDELRLADDLGDVAGADRLGGRDGDIDLREPFALEAGGEGDQPRVVPDRQCGDGGGIDTARQERSDGDVGAHVLGDGVLQDRGDLVIAGLLAAGAEWHRGESGSEVTTDLRRVPGANDGVASRLQAPDPAVQGFRFGYVLQHGVVLQGAVVDPEIQVEDVGQVEQALLLTAHRRAAGSGRHEQRFDSERIARTEQFGALGVPQCEREHAAQPGQRLGAPVVEGRDDGLAVAVGGEHRAEFGPQLLPKFQVVVDLAVEHQHVAAGAFRWAPAQRLVAVGDVDDREPVETQDDLVIRPGAGLVGTAVPHQVRGAGDGIDGTGGDGARRISYQRKQSAHSA